MIATTIPQSKHLLELNLPVETADMKYVHWANGKIVLVPRKAYLETDIELPILSNEEPAWSLDALLEVMSDYEPNLYKEGKRWTIHVLTEFSSHYTHGYKRLDAAYEMVVWLLENGYMLVKQDNNAD